MEIKIVDIIYASFLIEIVFVRCHKIRNKRFEKMENQEITSGDVVELEGSVKENIMCLVKCTESEDCCAVAISKTSNRCILLLEMLCQTLLSENYQWDVYKVATDWQLVFRGTAGINIPLVSTWTGLTPTTNPIECKNVTSTACGAHYRSPMIDSWSSCGVKQAKVELYDGGTSVAMIIFDAVGSDSLSWFSLPRLLESTWNIKKSETFDTFQLIGNGDGRTFYVSQHRHCPNDRGFLIAVDLGTKTYCSFDVMSSYPQFLYSTTRDKVIWKTKAYGMTDALSVYVRLT